MAQFAGTQHTRAVMMQPPPTQAPTWPSQAPDHTRSACLLTPAPANAVLGGVTFPGATAFSEVSRVPEKSPLQSGDLKAICHTPMGTRSCTHVPNPSLPVDWVQGLILTESLPLYILCQKTEYTKGNLALSTKQQHWAGPSLPFTELASSPGKHPREGVGDAGLGVQGANASCQVCAHWSALHPTSPGRGRRQGSFTEISFISRNHSKLGLVPETEINLMTFKSVPRPQPASHFSQNNAGGGASLDTSSRKFS